MGSMENRFLNYLKGYLTTGNINEKIHCQFFEAVTKELFTTRNITESWQLLCLLTDWVSQQTSIPIFLHRQYTTAASFVKYFNDVFVDETHVSHVEMLKKCEEITKKVRHRKKTQKPPFIVHLFQQVKNADFRNNLKTSNVVRGRQELKENESVILHVINHGLIMPFKEEIHGNITTNWDCNGDYYQPSSSTKFTTFSL